MESIELEEVSYVRDSKGVETTEEMPQDKHTPLPENSPSDVLR